jgi:formylglycine-generating enzyme required for sulfatase activity
MPRDDEQSLGDQQTYEGGAQPADSSDRSLGDQSTFGGGGESSLSDIGGLTGDADLDMEIVDLSRYEVQETLGKGGMGEVLLATDTRLNRKVAIKRMLGDAVKSQTAVKRFLTEAQSIAALNHFNIVQIHDYGRDKDGPFLIMEYVGGGSLLDKCREGALPLEEAVNLVCQLCDGLGMAHDAGIIHRDIKPANVLLTSRGEPKLTDFGLARQRAGDTGQTAAGAVLGTLDFMPPEQRRDATQTDNRSDLWSLAATLYQLVSGEPPRVIDLDEVPQELRTTLSKALKTKPDARYQTAREFRDVLRGCVPSAAPEVATPVAASPAPEVTGEPASIGMQFVAIPAGTFTMGDANGFDDETPHQVTLTQPFELGVYEVTQEQYEAVMGTNPSSFEGPQNPVEQVSWDDAVEFCRKLSELPAEKSAGYVYRLPTEAEWEYACRAGTTTKYSFGDSDSELGDYAWYCSNSAYPKSGGFWSGLFKEASSNHHPVGGKKPNAWGLYDMHGNVWEWCQDWRGDYPSGAVTDPTGAASGEYRVLRGGAGYLPSFNGCTRSALRHGSQPDDDFTPWDGFRPARTYNLSR